MIPDQNNTKTVVSARGFVFNAEGHLLVVSRDSLSWFLPGGWLEKLELTKFGCEREIFEETGLQVTALKVVFVQESIIDDSDKFGDFLHKFDLFCICECKNCDIRQWNDSDQTEPITERKFISEADWKSDNILAPLELKAMSFEQIKSLPSCYSWRNNIPQKYANLLK